jgi:hypothetical protein
VAIVGGYENGSLSERVERLEREVKELRSELEYTLRSAVPPVVEKRANTRKSGPTATRSTTPTPFPETATVSRSGSLEQEL